MKKIFFHLIIFLFAISCAGFKNLDNSNIGLNENNLNKIDGTYNDFPSSGKGFYVGRLTEVFDRNLEMYNIHKTNEKYDRKNVNLKLKMVNQHTLNVKIYEAENLLFDKDLKVKLKKDGFLYLKEKRFMVDGIPLILGGWNIQKSRFTIDQNNNLYVQSNYFFCHGILIVMSDWKTFHYDLTFEKIQ